MSSAICFNLDQSKILSSGNGLRMISEYGYRRQNCCGRAENLHLSTRFDPRKVYSDRCILQIR